MSNPEDVLFSGEVFIDINDIPDSELDGKIGSIDRELEKVIKDLDSLISHADKTDYTFAIASGVIAGIIDSLFIKKFDFERANQIGRIKSEKLVINIARMAGCNYSSFDKCQKFLEDFEVPGDKLTSEFGGGLQHHLRDFSHHCDLTGLSFSIITQFTGKVYGTDKFGNFIALDLPKENKNLIGDSFIDKFNKGVVDWICHMASDIAGSSSTIHKGGTPTSLPGPLLSVLKDLSSTPLFASKDKNVINEFSLTLSKLYNGTLLGERDANGKLIRSVRFNVQSEIGILDHIQWQFLPVILNEVLVRSFYMFRRLAVELNEKRITKVDEFNKIDWKKVMPFKNHTIDRMLTVSSLTFSFADTTDTVIRSIIESRGNLIEFGINFACRYNYVGAGRAAFAVVKEFKYEYDTINKLCEKRQLSEEKTKLVVEKVTKFNSELEKLMCKYVIEDVTTYLEALNDIDKGIQIGDSDLVIEANVTIQNKLGVKVKFNNQEEFNEIMSSDDCFVL